MNLPLLFGVNAALIALALFVLWLISIRMKDVSIVDIFWGIGFVLIAWATMLLQESVSLRATLIVVLATLWGGRLASYLAWRNMGKGEDYRYQAMREPHGARFTWVSLFTVFGLQGAVMLFVSLPLQAGQMSDVPLGWIDLMGGVIWTLGFLFESIGDWQLAVFKSNPANQGKVMDRGLWGWTRHPNYFGDFLVWWGFFVIALAAGAWWTLVSPLLMSFLLIRVSGVRLLENSLKDRRPEYVNYIERTSPFFPWLARKRGN